MLTKEYEIILPFIKEPWKKFVFKEIKKITRKKSESYIYQSLKNLVKENILVEERIGKSVVYSLDLISLKTQAYCGFITEYIAFTQKHMPNIENITKRIPSSFYSLIVTGSYAKNTQKENSDLDIVIILDDSLEPKKFYAELKYYCERNIPIIHLYVFKKSEFLVMLTNREANYGKEIAKNNMILYGAENYYNIIGEAIENGFNDKNFS